MFDTRTFRLEADLRCIDDLNVEEKLVGINHFNGADSWVGINTLRIVVIGVNGKRCRSIEVRSICSTAIFEDPFAQARRCLNIRVIDTEHAVDVGAWSNDG